ncbi:MULTISPECIES: type II toxin-antitoxin system Phd/YefM family antitoxin [Pseudidiomarina]|uniref:Antitoxin n=1 Tax=Pseudidiomarina atlantica TaxID=1517416 RepID=A0A094L459_9GAMM|nr:type II toxin-antitoxin system prevent-host-death family antitoxin [Pseudidiomarina atlantica]KFZ29448.1 prevent-host-death protein [Pseudidiomarina atlantica]
MTVKVITYSEARAALKGHMEAVAEDHIPTVITSQRGRPVVMLSLEDYTSMEETIHLLSSPANASRLAESIEQFKQGKASQRGLIDDQED